MEQIKIYLLALLMILLIDLPWIALVMSKEYGKFAAVSNFEFVIRPIPAFITYLILAIPFVSFLHNQSLQNVAICGFVIYGVFAFTNYAIFATWPLRLVVLDSVWGAVLFSAVSKILSYIQTSV